MKELWRPRAFLGLTVGVAHTADAKRKSRVKSAIRYHQATAVVVAGHESGENRR